jgi:hypothetical protein
MSYVHDGQYASLLDGSVRDRAVLLGCSCGAEMSILGEYLQRVKEERDEAVKLLRESRSDLHSWCETYESPPDTLRLMRRIDDLLSRYDLPEDYDEA